MSHIPLLRASLRFTITILTATFSVLSSDAQTTSDTVRITKGSYLHYGHAAIEDNSMYLEEAFNQSAGVVQFISGTFITSNGVETNFEIEIPLAGEKHQLTVGTSYHSPTHETPITEGFGDLRISYRPQVSGKHHWAMVIPRITIALPRKSNLDEFQYGKPNLELAVAVTKRLSNKFTSHVNVSTDYQFHNRSNRFFSRAVAASVIWAVRPKFNFLLESVYETTGTEGGQRQSELIFNPAVRFSFSIGRYQIIPGVGAPVSIVENSDVRQGVFLYLSVEPF